MDLKDFKHIEAVEFINEKLKQYPEEQVRNLSFLDLPSLSFEVLYGIIQKTIKIDNTYTYEEWNEIIDFVIDTKKNTDKIGIIEKQTRNDATVSTNPRAAWKMYEKTLKDKGWGQLTIDSIEDSSIKTLRMLSIDTTKIGPIKGLVLGNVQSGKTANMSGLISMAADYGFNCFIVLSGMIDNLREQTEKRLFDEVANTGNLHWHLVKHPHPTNLHHPEDNMDKLDLSNGSKMRYMSVVLKNSTRLGNLLNWLYSNKAKCNNLKVLIIDDEADQASVNTKKMSDDEEIERTKINEQIVNLVNGYKGNKLKASNYISYTATPYANVLNESGKESLYPEDFIVSLPISSDYIGPEKLFGLQEPGQYEDLQIINDIPPEDEKHIQDINEGYVAHGLPRSLKESIQWFLISAVGMKINGHKKPISMLVHVSPFVISHQSMEDSILRYLREVKQNRLEGFIKECKELFIKETNDFTREDFIEGMPGYSVSEDKINDYPQWESIENGLRALFYRESKEFLSHIPMKEDGTLTYHKGIHLCTDNSDITVKNKEFTRLAYPNDLTDPGHATIFLVIGGNTLSRGLTLEGLTSSYFMRNSLNSDTLMQMGRWFGYRIGYEVFPRIWLNSKAKERFQFVTQLDYELRDVIQQNIESNRTPRESALLIKNSPNNSFIRVTSNNKMQGAYPTEMDFSGISKQTIVFEDDLEVLSNNIKITEEFFEALRKPKVRGSRLIWNNVDFQIIKEKFFEKYQAPSTDMMFSNLKAFIEWCEKIKDDIPIEKWNVVFSSRGEIKEDDDQNLWNIHGYSVSNVNRSVLNEDNTNPRRVSIGALRSPKDLLSDIDEENLKNTSKMSEVRKIRKEYGHDQIPQLVIYRINKDSKPQNIVSKSSRKALNFQKDIIGISLMIPGQSTKKNLAAKLTINVDTEDNSYVEE